MHSDTCPVPDAREVPMKHLRRMPLPAAALLPTVQQKLENLAKLAAKRNNPRRKV
jgi:hypothetical protein